MIGSLNFQFFFFLLRYIDWRLAHENIWYVSRINILGRLRGSIVSLRKDQSGRGKGIRG